MNKRYNSKFTVLIATLVLSSLFACKERKDKMDSGREASDKAVCSCSKKYVKSKAKAFSCFQDHEESLKRDSNDLALKRYEKLKRSMAREESKAKKCIREWALEQESHWFEDQLVGPDFQASFRIYNIQNCEDLWVVRQLELE